MFIIFLTIVIGGISLFFAFRQFSICLNNKDEDIFFWGGSIFFALFPVLADGIIIFTGQIGAFNEFIEKEMPNYWTGVDDDTIFLATIFTSIFNFIYWGTSKLVKRKVKLGHVVSDKDVFNVFGVFALIILSVIPCAIILNEGANYILNKSSNVELTRLARFMYIFIPLGAIGAFEMIRNGRYFYAAIFSSPIILLSFVSQARALFFYVPSAILMAYIVKRKEKIKIKKIIIAGIVLLLLAQSVKIVTNESHGFWTGGNSYIFVLLNMFRDISVGDFYYSFHVRENSPEETTQGSSTLALLGTGIIPPFLGEELFNPQNTVIYKIYNARFGVHDYGSVHPTIYGYAFFDLGFFGLCLAIILPVVLRIYKVFFSKFVYGSAIPPVMISTFYFVAMRGSLNVAYFRLIYSGIFIFLLLLLLYHSQKIFNIKRVVR